MPATIACASDSNSKFGSALTAKHSRVRFMRLQNFVPSAKVFVGAEDNSFELESLASVRAGTSPEIFVGADETFTCTVPEAPNSFFPSAKGFVGAEDKFELESLAHVRAGKSPE